MKPVPILYGEGASLSHVASLLGVSIETLRLWCIDYRCGDQWEDGGRWRISLPAARAIHARDRDALAALRNGDRESDLVRPYLHSIERKSA